MPYVAPNATSALGDLIFNISILEFSRALHVTYIAVTAMLLTSVALGLVDLSCALKISSVYGVVLTSLAVSEGIADLNALSDQQGLA